MEEKAGERRKGKKQKDRLGKCEMEFSDDAMGTACYGCIWALLRTFQGSTGKEKLVN